MCGHLADHRKKGWRSSAGRSHKLWVSEYINTAEEQALMLSGHGNEQLGPRTLIRSVSSAMASRFPWPFPLVLRSLGVVLNALLRPAFNDAAIERRFSSLMSCRDEGEGNSGRR